MSDTTQAPPVCLRPRCPSCDKPLQPVMTWDSERIPMAAAGQRRFDSRTGRLDEAEAVIGFTYRRINIRWSGQYRSYGAFCTLRCCESFANAAYRAGYRIVRNPGA